MKYYAFKPGVLRYFGLPPKILLIMKMIVVILTACLMQVSASTVAQKINYSKKGGTLDQLFTAITKQTGYFVLYAGGKIDKNTKLDVDFKNADLKEVLSVIGKSQDLTYTLDDRNISLKPKEPSFLEGLVNRWAAIDVRGRVVDEQGKPMSGATVKIKGTNRAVITSSDGVFTFSGVEENAVLEISYLGYKVKEVKVAGEMGNVKMEVASGELEEVSVYSDGFQKIPKERATGSFSFVDNETLNKQVTSDILTRLEGTVPGMLLRPAPQRLGAAVDFGGVRGITTFNVVNPPLIVVDNFPYSGNLNNLNPNDIESITVLKDAAAASIWGAQAGKGVIVITTKKGSNNKKAEINFTANSTLQQKQNLMSRKQLEVRDYVELERLNFARGGISGLEQNILKPSLSPVEELLIAKRDKLISAAEAEARISELANRRDIREDYLDYVYQEPVTQRYSLNVNGGGSHHSYYVSAGYDNSRKGTIGDVNDRLTFNVKNSFNLLKNLHISTSAMYTADKLKPAGDLGIINNYPYEQLMDANGRPASVIYGGAGRLDVRSTFKQQAEAAGLLDWQYRPLDELKGDTEDYNTRNGYLLNASADYSFFKVFNVELMYQIARDNREIKQFISTDRYEFRNLYNRFTYLNTSGQLASRIPFGSIVNSSYLTNTTQSMRGRFNYNQKFGSDHEVTALLGYETSEDILNFNSDKKYGFTDQGFTVKPVDFQNLYPDYVNGGLQTIPYGVTMEENVRRFISVLGNFSYSYKQKYVLTASARKDGSNIFGVKTNQKWKPLWSVGLKWNVDHEPFWNLDWLPDLKLRATYGYTGSIGSGSAYMTARYGNPAARTGLATAVIDSPPNPDLRWEKQSTFNLGIDYGFRGMRLTGSVEYYRRNNSDIIVQAPLDPTTGFYRGTNYSVFRNYADILSEGVDVLLNSKNIDGVFKWNSNLTLGYSVNNVKTVFGTPTVSSYLDGSSRVENNKFPLIYSYKWGGLSPIDGTPIGHLNGIPTNNFSQISAQSKPEDFVKHGSAIPVVYGQIGNSFSYRNIYIDFAFLYQLGHYFRRSSYVYQGNHSDYYSRWRQPGDEQKTYVPGIPIISNNTMNNIYLNSEILVDRADFLRVQYINIGYNLSKLRIVSSAFKDLSITMNASNLGLLWKANNNNLDPESKEIQMPANFSFGLRASLK